MRNDNFTRLTAHFIFMQVILQVQMEDLPFITSTYESSNTQLIHVIPVDKQIAVTSLALPKTVYVRINMFIFPRLAYSSSSPRDCLLSIIYTLPCVLNRNIRLPLFKRLEPFVSATPCVFTRVSLFFSCTRDEILLCLFAIQLPQQGSRQIKLARMKNALINSFTLKSFM